VGWDNTPRRGVKGHAYVHATPRDYEIWLRGVIEDTRRRLPPWQRIVFVNAWNEWGEGTHLEPDLKYGYAYLDATQRALSGRMHWQDVLQVLRSREDLSGETLRPYLDDLEFSLLGLQRSADYFAQQNLLRETVGRELAAVRFTKIPPENLDGIPLVTNGHCFLDFLDGAAPIPGALTSRARTVHIVGWSLVPGIPAGRDTRRYLTLFNIARGRTYYGLLEGWDKRTDVAEAFPAPGEDSTTSCGFRCFAWFRDVPPGRYRMGITHVCQNLAGKNFFPMTITLG
jgi:Glycosyltransferase WbsX